MQKERSNLEVFSILVVALINYEKRLNGGISLCCFICFNFQLYTLFCYAEKISGIIRGIKGTWQIIFY